MDVSSGIALIVSLMALLYTVGFNRRLLRHQFWSNSEALYVQLEQGLAKSPNILRFHGIEGDIQELYGISVEELEYLLPVFTAGGIYDRTVGDRRKPGQPFELDGYYGELLKSSHTRRAWPLVSRLMAPSNYKSRLEATIRAIEQQERGGATLSNLDDNEIP